MDHVSRLPAAAPVIEIYTRVATALERYAAPVFDLAVRLYIARVFFLSGRTKIADWSATILLFQDEYQVPLLPPGVAAALGAFFELSMPVFLLIGLASRVAAVPLIAMTLVIQFVLGASNPDYDNVEHFYWLFLLGMIVVRGPGVLSLDYLIKRKSTLA